MKPLPEYSSILLAVDSSDYSNQAINEAVRLASLWNSSITATHVYAAKMHDLRFRQMESGLPEQFRQEGKLEQQRNVHDDLIARGLSIITDSYLDQVDKACQGSSLKIRRRSLQGKNYRALVNETNSNNYDLLVIGALGLGAVKGSRLGTVCGRVVRRSNIDTLVIKNRQDKLSDGPIIVAVDGSTRSYGGLLTAFALAKRFSVPVKVIAVFDPYYHSVAFNRIAEVLSEEAGKVFRFKEQEKLHEEIIDSGLARIYQGHLSIAKSIAHGYGITVETELLAGKPHDAIENYLRKVTASLLVIGKLGIHADPGLDIGGNAEILLHNVECSLLLSQSEYQPELDIQADVTTSWTTEAEKRMQRVPDFVQNMVRMAILRYAQERGHTVITERIVEEATARLMPESAKQAMQEIVTAYDQKTLNKRMQSDEPMRWTEQANALLETITDQSLRNNLKMRAEKKARAEKYNTVTRDHIAAFLDEIPDQTSELREQTELHWETAAIARLMRIPEGIMRDMSKARIEEYAREQELEEVSLEVAEQGLASARKAMQGAMNKGRSGNTTGQGKCPFTNFENMSVSEMTIGQETKIPWSKEAETSLLNIPEGSFRDMTRTAVETIAAHSDLEQINGDFVKQLMKVFAAGSQRVTETLPWDSAAREGIVKAPPMIRGMLVREIEGWARRKQLDRIDKIAVDAVKDEWGKRGVFHLDPDDQRNS
jgi:nucleotide-binding universal stress UspA family protein